MSEQSATTKASAEPQLCKMDCGFFGSNATGDCCSKCFNELKKKGGNDSVAPAPLAMCMPVVQETHTPMDVEESLPSPTFAPSEMEMDETAEAEAPADEKKRKKKKKTSYRSMMTSMTKRTKDESDIQKEREELRKVTGGGTFSKIDRI